MPVATTLFQSLIKMTMVHKSSNYEPCHVSKRSFCLRQSAFACGLTYKCCMHGSDGNLPEGGCKCTLNDLKEMEHCHHFLHLFFFFLLNNILSSLFIVQKNIKGSYVLKLHGCRIPDTIYNRNNRQNSAIWNIAIQRCESLIVTEISKWGWLRAKQLDLTIRWVVISKFQRSWRQFCDVTVTWKFSEGSRNNYSFA